MKQDLPCSLILPIASLDDLVLPWQDLLLEDLGTTTLVHTGNLENLGCIHIGVRTSTHDGNAADHALVHLYASTVASG